jgi:hypothetical protein
MKLALFLTISALAAFLLLHYGGEYLPVRGLG